jgi:hypothetical protein
MILIILHNQTQSVYDRNGRVLEEAGLYVSHGINVETGKTVIMPIEKWENFRHKCVNYEGEWYLK